VCGYIVYIVVTYSCLYGSVLVSFKHLTSYFCLVNNVSKAQTFVPPRPAYPSTRVPNKRKIRTPGCQPEPSFSSYRSQPHISPQNQETHTRWGGPVLEYLLLAHTKTNKRNTNQTEVCAKLSPLVLVPRQPIKHAASRSLHNAQYFYLRCQKS